jgi:SAM-dependent methyltransferase
MGSSFDQLYRKFCEVWGYEPSALAKKVARELRDHSSVLDIGAGQGKDSIFFASLGHKVTAVEGSVTATDTMRKRVKEKKDLDLKIITDDITDMRLEVDEYDLVFANMSLQFMTRGQRIELMQRLRASVKKGGFIAIMQPTVEETAWKKLQYNRDYAVAPCTLKFRGEVMNFAQLGEYRREFDNDRIVDYREGMIEDRGHPGFEEPHTHHVVSVVAMILDKSEGTP